MVRIGIVGSDNSHAEAFSKLCNLEGDPHLEGAKVVSIFGLDAARTQEVATNGKVATIVDTPEEMIGKIDAALVVFRHGGLHRQYAVPFLEAGIPVFVDKPLALTLEDGQAILAAAAKKGTPVTSFSTYRITKDMLAFKREAEEQGPVVTAVFSGPADRNSEYGGLPFYGIHAVEMAQTLFGTGVQSVQARQNVKTVVATLSYPQGRTMTLEFLADTTYVFHMLAFGKKGWVGRALDAGACYKEGLEIVLDMVKTGRRPLSDEEMLEPVSVLSGIERSLETGQAVEIEHI